MKKVLVPTDFSNNSKAGLQFVLQWSTREKLELIFVHALHILRPMQWTDSYFLKFAEKETEIYKKKLEKFIAGICKTTKIKPARYFCTIIRGFSADLAIMEYCRQRGDIDFICMSTSGAGGFKKILGTNTGNLITKSKVPVIAVPKNYKAKPITQLIYATDFYNCKEELKEVVAFARPLKINVEVLHFTWPDEAMPDKEIIESGMRKQFRFPLKLHFEKPDIRYSLIENLQKQIQVLKPSLAIMFTDQNRTLFQKIFLSSKAEQLSFQLKVPLLVFNKPK